MVLENDDDTEDESIRALAVSLDCPVVVTERLVLRPPCVEDVADIAALANNRAVAEMVARMPHPYTSKDASAFVAGAVIRRADKCVYAITLAETGAFIGGCGVEYRGDPPVLEIGYWVGEPHWGKGIATEVAHAIVDLAFRGTDAQTVHASCRVINGRSRRVLQKCGFQLRSSGLLKSIGAGGTVPVEHYALERSTWMALRAWGSAG